MGRIEDALAEVVAPVKSSPLGLEASVFSKPTRMAVVGVSPLPWHLALLVALASISMAASIVLFMVAFSTLKRMRKTSIRDPAAPVPRRALVAGVIMGATCLLLCVVIVIVAITTHFWTFGEVFDAIVPPLATSAAITLYAGSLLDAVQWYRSGTGSMSHLPLLMLCASASAWLIYGAVTAIISIIVSNAVGLLISLVAFFIFNAYSPTPFSKTIIAHSIVIAAFVVVFAIVAGVTRNTQVVGIIASLVAVAMFASPLATLRVVIETKSAASLPAPMILIGIVCTFLWTIYGIRLNNPFVYAPNAFALLLGLAQLVLLLYFGKNEPLDDAAISTEDASLSENLLKSESELESPAAPDEQVSALTE